MAAALTLPVGISLGIVTLEPLGSHFAPLGVAAGVYGVAICSLLVVVFGSRSPAINLPRSATAVFVAAMLLEASGAHRLVAGASPSPEFMYGLLFLFLARQLTVDLLRERVRAWIARAAAGARVKG